MNKITREQLIDPEDGENRAVRWFLACYGGALGVTVGTMKRHLKNCGYPFWPEWAEAQDREHLTKLGAQNWLRHLFALESSPEQPQAGQAKPVAWLPECGSPTTDPEVAASWRKHGGKVVPLYAAPPQIDTSAERVEKGGADRQEGEAS